MATHDYVIANASGAAVRQDINNALAAIVSNNSSATEPGTTYAFQFWFDTTNNILKIRNAANSAWIDWITTTATVLLPDGAVGTPSLTFASETDTGLYRIAANTLGIATSGTERVEISDTGIIVNEGGTAAIDVRIEGDNEPNLVFIDAGNDRIGIGDGAPGTTVEVASAEPRITVRNTTHEDADNGRESRIIFEGEQSGGEIATLAEIEASHEGTGDDERGQLIFRVNDGDDGASPTEVMRIDRSANVGIGESDPDQRLHVKASADDVVKIESTSGADGPNLTFTHSGPSPADDDTVGKVTFVATNDNSEETTIADIKVISTDVSDGSEDGAFTFSTRNNGTFAERVRITSDGTLQLRNSPGIDFSEIQTNAANMTSETLDSYEEGTWTPVFAGGTTAGTYTYGSQAGFYTKIGRKVYVTATLNNIDTSSEGAGELRITGLPFTPGTGSSNIGQVFLDNFNFSNSAGTLCSIVAPSETYLTIREVVDNGSDTTMSVTDRVGSSSDLVINCTYIV